MRIGIFDSGIGGLNVLKELLKVYPNNHYIYYGDTLNLPYGDKKKEELLILSSRIIDFLINKEVDLIIIACGTISSTCYFDLKSKYYLPIYDIITPTINYINSCSYNNIGIIGTTRTIESNLFKTCKKNITMKATPLFVPIIENNDYINRKACVKSSLSIFKNKIDSLVLGCTHYPLLEKEINNYLSVPLIDMGKCLASTLTLTNNDYQRVDLYFTKLNEIIENNIKNIIVEDYLIYKN